MEFKVFLQIIVVTYLIFSVFVTLKVKQTKYLSNFQKKLHILLLWLLPFVWGFVIYSVIKPSLIETMTKDKRKVEDHNNSDNWGSLTGGVS